MKYIVYNNYWNIQTRPFDKLSDAKKHIDIYVKEQLKRIEEKEVFTFSDKVLKAMEKEVRASFGIQRITDKEDLLKLIIEIHSIIKNLPCDALTEEAEDWLVRTDSIYRGIEK